MHTTKKPTSREILSSKNFILVNALAIDMDWVNKIQERWDISFDHENYYLGVADIEEQGFETVLVHVNNKTGECSAYALESTANDVNIVGVW